MEDLRKYEYEQAEDDFEEDEEYWRETHVFKSPEEESYDKGYNQALEDIKGYLDLTSEQLEIINCLRKE
jgi:hypothetical protein